MVAKIRPGTTPANLEKLARDLDQAAGQLQPTSPRAKAKKRDAFSKLTKAEYEALSSTAKMVEGVAEAAGQAAELTATGGLVSAGVRGWVSESAPEGAVPSSRSVARGLATMVDVFGRLFAKLKTPTVRELKADPYAVDFGERMFGKPGLALDAQAGTMNTAWQSYAEALSHVDPATAATNVASVSDQLAKAAALTTSAQATKIAEFGLRLSTVASRAADKGADGAHDIALLCATLAATSANVLANPDQSQVKDVVTNQIATYKSELSQLVASHPGLTEFATPLLNR